MSHIKQYPLYNFYKRYTIDKFGNIISIISNKKVKTAVIYNRKYVLLDNGITVATYPVDELMIYTFIGKLNLTILYIDGNFNNTDLSNLTYIIDSIIVSGDEIKIADETFYRIPEFKNYFISKCGILYSLHANKLLKRTISHKSSAYIKFRFSEYSNNSKSKFKKSKRYNVYLHHLMFKMFIGDIPEGYEIDHINGNQMDNSVDNLQLLTREQNTRKMKLNGNCRWSLDTVKQVCALIALNKTVKEIYEILEIDDKNAFYGLYYNIKKGESWKDIMNEYKVLRNTDDMSSTTIERII